MLNLVTPATEAVDIAKRHMPGLHEFLYADALDFAKKILTEHRFHIGGSWDEQRATLTACAIGFVHGEVIALTGRRDEGTLLPSMPMALVGHPVWNRTIQLIGETPVSPASLVVAMEYVTETATESGGLPAIIQASLVAYGIALGYERGYELGESEEGLPLSPQGTSEFMSTVERLLETVAKSVSETTRHHGEVLGALYAENEAGREEFRLACTHATAEYATNAILSLAHKGHLLCASGIVIGRIRAYASQFASGLIDGMLGVVDTDSLVQAMFAEGEMSEGLLCGESMPTTIRNASIRICDEPLTDGMLPLAVARAWDLMDDYGEGWTGPVDIMPTGEEIGGVPAFVLVDTDERIAVSAVAYACGVRASYEGDIRIPYARKAAAREVYESCDEPAWDAVWDIEASDVLPAWASISVAHPIRTRVEEEGDEASIPVDGTEEGDVAGNGTDGQVTEVTGSTGSPSRRLRLV